MANQLRDMSLVLDGIEEAEAQINDMIVAMRFAIDALSKGPGKDGQAETWMRGLLGVLIAAGESAQAALGDVGLNAISP